MLHRPALSLLGLLLCAEASAHPPRGIVVDAGGNVYFSDLERIWKIDRQGQLTLARAGVSGRHIHELVIDRFGSVYGDETSYDPTNETWPTGIWKMGPDGRVMYLLPTTTSPPPGTGLWRDARGCTYLAQQERAARGPLLFRRCPRQRPELLFGSRADARAYRQVLTSNISGTAMGPEGAFYFRHGGTVRKRSPDGAISVAASGLPVENYGLAVGADRSIYVAELAARRVTRTGANGRRSTVATAAAPWGPTGVFWRSGVLYILEVGIRDPHDDPAFRVRKLLPNGGLQTLATLAGRRR